MRSARSPCTTSRSRAASGRRPWPTSASPSPRPADFFFEDAQGKMYDERSPKKDGEVDSSPKGKKFKKDNWMKAAFINSDRNITVSMNYAKEISGSASKGVELNTIINATGGIEGIVNGMDPTEWNPHDGQVPRRHLRQEHRRHGQGGGEAGAPGRGWPPARPRGAHLRLHRPPRGAEGLRHHDGGGARSCSSRCPNAQVVILGTGKKSMEKTARAASTSSRPTWRAS